MVKGKKEIQREEPELNSDEESYKIEETVKELVKEDNKLEQPKPKRGRKKAVEPGQVLTVEKQDEEPISFNKAKELVKAQKPKFEPSEKQKANTARLIEANRLRREANQEAKEKADALEEAKLKQKKLVVLPKRTRTKKDKEPKQELPESDSEQEPEPEVLEQPKKERKQRKQKIAKVYDGETTDGDTTDTRTIKKKIEKVKMIDETIKQSKFNAISKGFF